MAGVASARIANRHALHSVYYSTAKKTALPLNETCTRASCDTRRRISVTTVAIIGAHARRAITFVLHRRDCKKHDEIRIFVTAVTGSPRIFEKEFALIDCCVLR